MTAKIMLAKDINSFSENARKLVIIDSTTIFNRIDRIQIYILFRCSGKSCPRI